MPIIHVELVEGRTKEQKKQLGLEITKATVDIMKVPTEAVKVIFVDMKKDDFMEGGVLRSEK
ncbi:4-oxalocrotonate tautomerase [uncultured Veillonella sp.]|uniref:4-oxalocrotonate tautomerase n=1 Tax=uncultured Veillonella sp. TaxID=159268 RepID=UPI0025F34075|nr:4-oxalocrotonate tautomerase [uncultured Veillonella sp.]MDY3973260.1 4-oxalocrotonate tautomerase [Veillonella caviae]